jgi:hypothetical protein
MQNIFERVKVLFPFAKMGIDLLVAADTDHPGEEVVVEWNIGTLGIRDDAALAAVDIVPPRLLNYAARKRRQGEQAGITVGGVPVATDRESQAMLTGAAVMAQANPSFSTQWKGPDGVFVTLSATQIVALAEAVAMHVATCFATEAGVVEGINANPRTITTTEQIDAAFAT